MISSLLSRQIHPSNCYEDMIFTFAEMCPNNVFKLYDIPKPSTKEEFVSLSRQNTAYTQRYEIVFSNGTYTCTSTNNQIHFINKRPCYVDLRRYKVFCNRIGTDNDFIEAVNKLYCNIEQSTLDAWFFLQYLLYQEDDLKVVVSRLQEYTVVSLPDVIDSINSSQARIRKLCKDPIYNLFDNEMCDTTVDIATILQCYNEMSLNIPDECWNSSETWVFKCTFCLSAKDKTLIVYCNELSYYKNNLETNAVWFPGKGSNKISLSCSSKVELNSLDMLSYSLVTSKLLGTSVKEQLRESYKVFLSKEHCSSFVSCNIQLLSSYKNYLHMIETKSSVNRNTRPLVCSIGSSSRQELEHLVSELTL